jgi:predicted nucleotidyltransferase
MSKASFVVQVLTLVAVPVAQFLPYFIEYCVEKIKSLMPSKTPCCPHLIITNSCGIGDYGYLKTPQDEIWYNKLKNHQEDRTMAILTIDEIKEKVAPIAERYHLKAVYLFGSYARGEADEKSDIDLIISYDISLLDDNIFLKYDFKEDVEITLNKKVDVVDLDDLENEQNKRLSNIFISVLNKEKEKVYAL